MAYLIGVGLALFPINNLYQPGIERIDGQIHATFFLPVFGLMLVIVASLQVIKFPLDMGSKKIYIPLLVIVASMAGQFVISPSMSNFAVALLGVCFFFIYIAGRTLKLDIIKALAPFIIIGAISVIVYGLRYPGVRTAGWISSSNQNGGNYDIATGYLVFGMALITGLKFKYKWLVFTVVTLALCFTGADEALVAMFVIGVVMLIRKDYNRRVLIVCGLSLIIGLTVMYFVGGGAFKSTVSKIAYLLHPDSEYVIQGQVDRYDGFWDYVFNNRFDVIIAAMKDIKPLGHGFELTKFTFWTVHNVPLIIVDQIGIAAAIAWVWVVTYCLKNTTWKYAWIAVIVLSSYDHYIWDQLSIWWWILVGISTSTPINDLIFNRKCGIINNNG